jgi:ABC-type branched-subunit amino acid transport system ATPase component
MSALDRVFTAFPVLADRRSAAAGTLSGGQGRMLSVAREMMTTPDLMLVDEPTAGLSPPLVPQVYELLHAARRAGSTILLVDQNIEDAVREADHVYLVDLGRVRAHGPAHEFPPTRVRVLIQECLLR